MNFFDYVLITAVGLSMVLSIWRGFVREIISLIGLVLAFLIASNFSDNVGNMLDAWITQETLANIAGFVLLFVLIMFIVGGFGFMIRKLVDMADLTATDRTLGIFFGAARGVLLIGVAFLLYTSSDWPTQPWMDQSLLTPYALELSDVIGGLIPDDSPLSAENALDSVQKHITPSDQEAMKDLLIDTLKDNQP